MASNLDKLTDEQINGPLRGKNKLTEEDLQGPVTGLPDSLAAKEIPKPPVDIGGGPIVNRFLGIAAPSDPQQPEGWQPSSAPKVEPTYLYEQPTLTSGRLEESFIDKAVHGVAKFLGFDPDQLSEQAKADALIQVMAKQTGLPLHEYRKSPEAIEQLTKGIVSGFTGGLAPAFMESATGEKPLPTTSTSGYVAERLGSLSGFLAGPVQIAKAIPSIGKVLSGTKATQSMSLLRRMVTDAVHQSILLGTAATISELGEAGKSLTFSDAVKKLGWAGISGSITGATFGIARGMFPADGIQQGARLITGLLGLNAQRVAETGKNPWTDRPLGEVVFDTALDAFFLWSGLPKSKVDRITNDLNSVVEKKTEIAQKEQIVQQIPEQEIRLTQEKIIESEKQQAEQNAKAVAEEIKKDVEEAQQTIETAKKIRKVKEKKVRTPEEQAALNERMAALRAMRGKTGEAKVAKPAVQVPTLQVEPSVPGILAAPTPEKPLPGIEKPVVTKPESPIVTGQQITDIEKFYGKGIEDLTDEQVNDYLSKIKTEEIKPIETKPVEESTIESEIEKYYGKPLDQITDKEMEKFLDLEPIHEAPVPAFKPGPSAEELKHAKTKEGESVINTIKRALKEVETGKPVEIPEEPIKVPEEPTIRPKPEVQTKQITEVDTRTGSSEPEEIVGEESIFNEDPEAMVSRAQLYAKSKSVADSIDQLSDQDPTQPLKDVGTTTWKLINDVNRWKAGASVDIDKVRDFLSELAADADQYRNHFIGGGYPESFFAWKEMIEEAANWARKQVKGKIQPTDEPSLYSGVDPFETIRRVKELFKTNKKPTEIAGSNFANYLKKADEAKEIDVKESLIQGRKGFVRSVIDRSGNLRKALLDLPNDKGYEATQLMYLQKGGHPKASRMLDQMIKEVDAGLTANEKKIKHGLILAKRIIDITGYKTEGRQFVTPTGASRSEALIYNTRFGRKSINGLEELTPDRMAKIERAAKTYIDWMKKPVEDAFKEGLITEKERDALISHDYRRIRLIEDIYDKKNEVMLGGHRISVYDSGIERLQRGKKTDIYERNSDVMALEVFNRLYSRIYKNRAGLVALDMARKYKNNPFFRVKESKEDKIPPEFRVNRAFVYENGKRKTLFLSPEVAQEWLASSAQVTWKYAQAVKWITGAPVVRTFATGINWAFALRNLPRDMTTLWFSARQFENGKWKSVYSPISPKFLYEIGQDINEVADDVLFRKGQYDDYIDDGGGMDLLTIQGRPLRKGRHIGGPLDKVMDVMAYPGTTSELITRLAIRRRVIKNRAAERGMTFEEAAKDKKIRREATFAARDYLDFSQGGDIAKAADHGFPFLNARIQALRGIIRSFKPGSGTEVASMLKLAQFVGAITALYIGNQKRSPETMKAMQGNRRAKGNLVFPLGDSFGFEDSTGQMRYPFIVVPIDQTMKFFKIFAEGAVDLWLGNPVDTDAIAQSLRDFSPADITTLPPTVSGALGYVQNRDFWLGKDIRKQDELFNYPESAKEFTPGKQSQLLIDIGQQTGLSPERLKYVVEQLITHDNLYAQILGWSYEEMYGKMPKSKRDGYVSEWLSKAPLARSFFALTNPYDQFGKEIDEAKEKSLIDRYIENSGLDVRVNGYLYEKTQTREDVIKYINSFDDMKTVDRLIDRFKFQEDIKGLPNRSFWLRLKGLDDEARAAVYVDRVRKSSDDEIRQLNKELGIVINAGGVVTNGFMEEVMRIQAGKGSSRPLPNIVWPEVQPEKQKSGTLAPGPFEGTRP